MRSIVILWICILPVYSQTVSFSLDNDYVFDSDNGYTGGIQIGWMSDAYDTTVESSYVSFLDKTVTALFPLDKEGKYVNGAANLQEIIITPNDTNAREPIYDDVPYIGVLTANFSYFLWNTESFEEFRVSVGTVGSYSGAEELQNGIHKLIGDNEAEGWKNQLGNYIVLQAGYQKGVRQYTADFSENKRFEWFNSYFLDVGNIYNGLGVGSAIRYGYNMPNSFSKSGSLLNSSQNDQLNLDPYPHTWGWSVHAGIFVDAIGYFYLMEKAEDLGYDVDTKKMLTRGEFGIDLYQKNYRIALELFPVLTSHNGYKADSYGRMTFTWYFK